MAKVNKSSDRDWLPAPTPGVTYTLLRMHGENEGATYLTRFAAGTRGGKHVHPGGEELLILEGECELNGVSMRAGDYMYTPPGEGHELVALTDTLVYVQLPKHPIYEKV
jgi:quercetin dioxygenase-like cupin family protein